MKRRLLNLLGWLYQGVAAAMVLVVLVVLELVFYDAVRSLEF